MNSEYRFRLRVVQVGVGVTAGLAIAGGVYVASTTSGPNRPLLAAILALAACDGAAIWALRSTIARSPHVELIFAAWNAAHVVAGCVASALDGGADSPFVLILFVSIAFAAVSLSRAYLIAVSALDLAALVGAAALAGAWNEALVFQATALIAIAAVCGTIAGERAERLMAVQEARIGLLQRLVRVIEFRDLETGEHVERMSRYSALIAHELGWSRDDVEQMRLAASMHDIGKVAVPDAVLLKPGPLDDDERRLMERHTLSGWDLLSRSSSDEINLAATIALTHHERWDGTGYPQGLAGDEIPLAGRIVAVADVFDALSSERVYRRAMSVDDSLEIIRAGRGTHFDPEVLDAFEAALDRILEVRANHQARERIGVSA